FDDVLCKNARLIVIPKKAGKEPLDFEIHDLFLRRASIDKPLTFRGNLTNAKPKGEIATSGSFGPWDIEEPGNTLVSGSYTFTDADLGSLPGIAGILSSTGKYLGQLDKIEVQGETDTPPFSVNRSSSPMAVSFAFPKSRGISSPWMSSPRKLACKTSSPSPLNRKSRSWSAPSS